MIGNHFTRFFIVFFTLQSIKKPHLKARLYKYESKLIHQVDENRKHQAANGRANLGTTRAESKA